MPTTKIDGFLKVPDIKGPSTRDGHEDEIEIHGVDYKMVAPYDPNSVSRFAHYLKAIARDKIGSFKERSDMQIWLTEWINRYVLANPAFADDKARAKRPLAAAEVQVDSVEGRPGYYAARFYLRPHYQLEGINASLRLVSELPSVKT